MRYFILLKDGSRFGPVDVSKLQEYVNEGGVLPTAQLEQEGGDTKVSAVDIEGLVFPEASIRKVGQMVKDAQTQQVVEQQTVRSAWLMVLLSPVVCGFSMCVPWGLFAAPVIPIAGILYANKMPSSKAQMAKSIRLIAIAELVGAVAMAAILIYMMASGRMPSGPK